MPIDLRNAALATAATACRAMAYQEGERAKRMENPTRRGPLESSAKRFAALAEKLEAAREALTKTPPGKAALSHADVGSPSARESASGESYTNKAEAE